MIVIDDVHYDEGDGDGDDDNDDDNDDGDDGDTRGEDTLMNLGRGVLLRS